jgi:hypothetical protein
MDIEYKKNLGAKLVDVAPKYNLPDIVFPSFDKTFGYVTSFTASDVVYAMNGLLDCGASLLGSKGVSGFESMLNSGALSSITSTLVNRYSIQYLIVGANMHFWMQQRLEMGV